ncbi:MAG: cation diffusion facilitator family transporter [Chloroflexota bacterium]|nr:cation diffusion facilitator family transporter [Chloroflexota bacterium]
MMNEYHHSHHASKTNQKRLLIALSITGLMTIVELVGGLLSNSLALLGDAAHMFTDTLALGLSLFALNMAKRPPSESKTFGYLRAEILAALANGSILIMVSGYIFYEAYQRFSEPPEVQGGLMLIVAAIGLIANLIGISILRSGSRENLNVKGAFLHMWGDAVSSLGVIAAGIIILVTGWHVADPIISIIIGILILRGAIGLVLESSSILLEAVPRHLDVSRMTNEMKIIDGLRDVHDVHVWTITSGVYALSAHLLIEDQMVSRSNQIIEEVNHLLRHEFGIGHSTLQLECQECENSPLCQIGGETG